MEDSGESKEETKQRIRSDWTVKIFLFDDLSRADGVQLEQL